MSSAELRQRLVEILTEFGERAHEAEEGIAVSPPPDEVNRAVDAILQALGPDTTCPTCGGRGWHTAGGNDPMPCGRCPAGEAWSSEREGGK